MISSPENNPAQRPASLVRGITLPGATALNMIDMIGVGPFITIPLIISAIGGPQAMLGWILGALLAVCDGMVWAELGAAFPGSGGSYRYLNEIYGAKRFGRLLSFLFIWQISFSAPLSIASGCIGLSQYAGYLWPGLQTVHRFSTSWSISLPVVGIITFAPGLNTGTLFAVASCLAAVILLYRRITGIAAIAKFLWVGVILTIAWVIVAGLTHFNSARAFDFPSGAFQLSRNFFTGLGAAMLVATYDYWGYYNVCFVGGEVKDPGRNIPRAILYSIAAVACLYMLMNISILGVIPWRELVATSKSTARFYVVSTFMQRIYGHWAGVVASVLVMWTAFASVFSLLLGYSRVPFAAARDGNYFKAFAHVHPKHSFPDVSLLVLGGAAAFFCLFPLGSVIAALVVIRIMIQFLVQAAGVIVLRHRRPELPRPFRMWLYPLPPLLAIAGFLYVLISRRDFLREVRYGALILAAGVLVFLYRSWRRPEWPFAPSHLSAVKEAEATE